MLTSSRSEPCNTVDPIPPAHVCELPPAFVGLIAKRLPLCYVCGEPVCRSCSRLAPWRVRTTGATPRWVRRRVRMCGGCYDTEVVRKVRACRLCGWEMRGEEVRFTSVKRCRNTEACRRRAAAKVGSPAPTRRQMGRGGLPA